MDKNLLWAYKMTLLDQLNESKVLNESLTTNERKDFIEFINNLDQVFIRELDADVWKAMREDDPDVVMRIFGITKATLNTPEEKERQQKQWEYMLKAARNKKLFKKVAIGVGIAAILSLGAYYVYKRYKDQCKKQCKTSNDPDCLNKCRQVAMRASITKLQAAKSVCKTKKCKDKTDKEIKKWQVKLANLK